MKRKSSCPPPRVPLGDKGFLLSTSIVPPILEEINVGLVNPVVREYATDIDEFTSRFDYTRCIFLLLAAADVSGLSVCIGDGVALL